MGMKAYGALVGVVVMLILSTSLALAIPQMPHTFHGAVTIIGPAPDGLVICPRINGISYPNASVTISGGKYFLDAPADDPETLEIVEGGVDGDLVEFLISGVLANEKVTFSIRDVTKLDLTVDDTVPPTVTLPAYAPDPTTDNTPTYSGTAADALTNVIDIEYRVDGGTWTDVDAFTSAPTVNFTFTTPVLVDGTHTIEVKAKDVAGNWSSIASDTLAVTSVVPPPSDFTISVSPTSGSVVRGGSTTTTVSLTSIAGFAETVVLSVSGLPSGATESFSPSSGTPNFTSTLTISTASTTPTGTYSITIKGTGGGKTHSCTYTLTVTAVSVPDFSIGISPALGSVVQGKSTTATVSVSPIAGFSDTVNLSVSGLPSGAAASFSPSSGTPSFDSTLTISTVSTTPTGTYSVTIKGTNGGKIHSCTYTLTVTAVPVNQPPTADAGGPYSVDEDETVELDGKGSSDPDGDALTYSWTITNDPTGEASLTDANTSTPTFHAPSVDSATDVTVELTVDDGHGHTDSDAATVTVEPAVPPVNQPPTADAGGPYSVDEEKTVKLDGTGSSDPDGDALTYSWTITSDPTGESSLTNSDIATPTFHAPSVDSDTNVTVKLTVDDGHGHTDSDTATVSVKAVAPPPDELLWAVVLVILIVIVIVAICYWKREEISRRLRRV